MFGLLVKHKKKVSLLLSVLGLTFVFISGFFTANTQLEKIAEYATEVVKNHTNGKSLCALTVEKTPESGAIIDYDSEFHNLYGTFKQQKITFASVINADKRHNITIDNDISDNLSMVYVGPVGSISYNGHFKHYVSPMEIMFPDEKIYDISKYVAYISQTHADRLLEENNVSRQPDGTYSEADYSGLLKQLITIRTDEGQDSFAIQNIYYQSNYYYEGLHEVVGDFVMVSYWVPGDLQTERQNMYFMSDYTYQNKYFMNYINSAYPSKKYLLKVNRFNIVGEINEDYLTSFYYSDVSGYDWLFVLLFIFSISLLVLSLCFYYMEAKHANNSMIFISLRIAILFVPYLIFFLLHKITKNVSFLSETSSKANVWLIIGYILLFALITLFMRNKKDYFSSTRMEAYYEINI